MFALLAAASWNRWIEPYVDTGRELMVPWRLAQGERLYADVHFHHGPLGPWLAAAVDRLAGRSLPARTGLAFAIAVLHLVALDRVARRVLSPWRAALATSVAVGVAVFLRPGGWLFPFSLDCALAVAALTWALAALESPRRADGLAAFCLLAAILSRVEIGLAGVVVFAWAVRREPIRLLRLAFFPVAAGAAVYASISVGIPRDRLIADGWLRVISPPEAFGRVYRAYAGLDRVGLRAAELALCGITLLLIAGVLVVAAFAAERLRRRGASAAPVEVPAMLLLAAAAALMLRPPASLAETLSLWPPLVRAIPPCVVVAAALRLWDRLRVREPRGPFSAVPDAALWLAALFALRLFLAAGYVGPYDAFFLPLPAVVGVASLFGLADRAAPSVGRSLPGLTAAALVLFLLVRGLTLTLFYRQTGWDVVRTPAGALRLPEPVAGVTNAALAELGARARPGMTLTGFPEAGFFEYVLGLESPFWLEQFFPGHLDAAGESRAIAAFAAHPPDLLLYANVLAVGEGQRAFGIDYLARLDAAARGATRPVASVGPGARPGARVGDPDFFVEIRVPEGAVGEPDRR